MTRAVAVLGAGSWGTSLAVHLGRLGHDVRLWARDGSLIDQMRERRVNPTYLPEIELPERVALATAIEDAAIAVERATGPVMLISGGDDRMWPAERMCRMVVDRMHRRGRGSAVSHVNHPEAGHVLFPYPRVSSSGPMAFDLGGSPEAAAAVHRLVWTQVVKLLQFKE